MNFIMAFGIVMVLEIIAGITGVPLGILVIFGLIFSIYYGQNKKWF